MTGPGRQAALITGLRAWTRGHDPHGDDANMRAFHSGRWVPRPDPPGGES